MNKKLEKALNWTLAIVCIIGTFYFTSAQHDDLHETHLNGEETIGIVVKRSTSRSVIYIDEPIMSEYRNIPQTREWLLNEYYSDITSLKLKGARDLSEINHMLPDSLRGFWR